MLQRYENTHIRSIPMKNNINNLTNTAAAVFYTLLAVTSVYAAICPSEEPASAAMAPAYIAFYGLIGGLIIAVAERVFSAKTIPAILHPLLGLTVPLCLYQICR